ncbi:MAG TPA: transglycosylase SLT domain-containing protein [Actinophytocola sp.]|uniref:transglycosylase SLT domain-containing protein n=1 Tax=Actinophytocola sp. TaxID=1872138 RepID=UPI002DBA4E9A|nr:transglycosylase SLT domain-containing protein [Actinophytocola sp.]HEU5474215.1 transglycosylase SLT domain-containing protein [Actinophytocola sp.]
MNAITDIAARIQQLNNLLPTQLRPVQSADTKSANDFAAMLTSALGRAGDNGATGVVAQNGVAGSDVVSGAQKYIGVPYVWGGTDPKTGLDCSGLVQRVYGDLGIDLPRVSRDQAKVGQPVASLDQAQPGDLLAFGSPVRHIGIYVGDGKMIHAPEPGASVRVQNVYETPTAIRRVVPNATGVTAAAPAASGGSGPYADLFTAATAKYGLPQGLLSAVAKQESNYNPNAVSGAGARGLMQIMPATAAGLGVNPMDPTQAVDGAARLLSGHLNKFGSVPLALAAYNAGPGAVQKHNGIPPYQETQNYVRKIMANLSSGAAA